MKKFLTAGVLLATAPAFAHEGHGHWASFAHDYEHGLMALGAAAIIASALYLLRKRGNSTRT